jgi:hypothetical protein
LRNQSTVIGVREFAVDETAQSPDQYVRAGSLIDEVALADALFGPGRSQPRARCFSRNEQMRPDHPLLKARQCGADAAYRRLE